MKPITYNTLATVIESWEEVRRVKNFEEEAGVVLYKHLFTIHPEVQVLFGLADLDVNSEELLESRRFRMQSKYMIQMLDTSLNMLGPDIELLTEINTDLGKRHVRYGVTIAMYEFMGEALLYTLDKILGERFTPDVKEAWEEVYAEIANDIISAYPQA